MLQVNVMAELDVDFDETVADALIDPIAEYSGAAGRSEFGRTEIVFTLPADSIRQATATALAILTAYEWDLQSLRVLPTADFDKLASAVEIPDLVSAQQAAEILGMTSQGVRKAIDARTLPATRVGSSWVIRRDAVDALALRRSA